MGVSSVGAEGKISRTSFPLDISHSQLAVFHSSLQQPFNMWTDAHVRQGFAWRQSSTSFRTIEEAGRHSVEVIIGSEPVDVASEAVRIIQVPFEAPSDGLVEIASISDAVPLSLPPGTYSLRFECFGSNAAVQPTVRLIFTQSVDAEFRIIRADRELSPTGKLVTTASPA